MSLEASLTPYSLKKLTFALACLSRFGEDVHIQAVKTELVLSTLNSSKTSYAQFTFSDNFFESYEVEMATKKGVTCHLNAKALLGVFRSRGSLEKTAERCEISLYDSERKKPSKKKDKDKEDRKGNKRKKVTDSDEEENDDHRSKSSSSRSPSPSPAAKPPPSRLNIKFICNNSFVKTHSLFISTSHSTRRPTNNTEGEDTSAFKVSPKLVSEWMEPFPGWTSQAGAKSGGGGGGQKKEGYLAWTFGDRGVRIGTWEGNPRADRLSTEFAVEADEFDEFYLSISPVAFGFPMREFKAITFLATQLSVPISCVFTTPLAPLYVTLSHPDDVFDATFTIMTQEVPKSSASAAAAPAPVQRVKTEAEKARRRSAGMASSSGGVASGSGSKKKTLRMGNLEDGEQEEERAEGSESGSRTNGKSKGKERAAPPSSRVGDQDMDDANGNGDDQQQLYPDDEGPAFDFAMDDGNDFDPNQENQPPDPPRHFTANANNTPPRARNGGKPTNEEPLFFPNSQEQAQLSPPPRQYSQLPPSSSQQRAFPQSQLSQTQMEGLGLGDLEQMDWGAEVEDEAEEGVEVQPKMVEKGNGKGKGKEVLRREVEEVDPEKTDDEKEQVKPRRESRVRVRESGKAGRIRGDLSESRRRSRSRSRGRSARGGTAMTDGGDGEVDLRVPATLRDDENRFMFDKSDDDDDGMEDEEDIEEDSSREASRGEGGEGGREMSPEL